MRRKLLLFALLTVVISTASFGDNVEEVIQYTDASTVSSIREIITVENPGPYYLKGELYIGDSDGEDISDGIFTYTRHITTAGDGYFPPGSSYFGMNIPESMMDEGPYLGRFEVELYKNGELMRTLYAERVLHPSIWVYSSFDPVLLNYDTVKYKCDIYTREMMTALNKEYHLLELSLSDDAEIIKKVIKKAYGYNIVHNVDAVVEVDKDYLGFSGFEDHYIAPDGIKYYTDVHFEKTEGIDDIRYESDLDGTLMAIENWEEIIDGEVKKFNNLIINFDFDVCGYFKIYLYDESTNTRGFELSKILVIYPFKDNSASVDGTNELVMQSLREQRKVEAQRNHSRVIEFPDQRLEKLIRDVIEKPEGDIYESDVLEITNLNAEGKGIKDIEGLQYFKNLWALDLTNNRIKDISAVSDLDRLLSLLIGSNQIADINALANLKNLEYLHMQSNKISDIEVLRELTKLRNIIAFGNSFKSVESLSDLTDLESLWMDWDEIKDKKLLEGRGITLEK